jgi:hypothetical protein
MLARNKAAMLLFNIGAGKVRLEIAYLVMPAMMHFGPTGKS